MLAPWSSDWGRSQAVRIKCCAYGERVGHIHHGITLLMTSSKVRAASGVIPEGLLQDAETRPVHCLQRKASTPAKPQGRVVRPCSSEEMGSLLLGHRWRSLRTCGLFWHVALERTRECSWPFLPLRIQGDHGNLRSSHRIRDPRGV